MLKISQSSDRPRRWPWMLLSVALVLTVATGLRQRSRQAAFAESLSATPEPEACAVCGGARYHAPCLVNLSTGEVGELTVYERDPLQTGEIAQVQQDGYFSLGNCAGLQAARDADARTCTVNVPSQQAKIDPAFFCRDCRALLTETAQRGYVLLDLHDLQAITAYPVNTGAEYEIRDYTVSVQQAEDRRGLTVTVRGRVFLD